MKIKTKNVPAYNQHVKNLCYLSGFRYPDGQALYESLRRLDNAVCRYNEDCCNIADFETDNPGKEKAFKKRLSKLFNGNLPKGFFINGDPRGYALKLEEPGKYYPDINIHQDWGGYGILAPEF